MNLPECLRQPGTAPGAYGNCPAQPAITFPSPPSGQGSVRGSWLHFTPSTFTFMPIRRWSHFRPKRRRTRRPFGSPGPGCGHRHAGLSGRQADWFPRVAGTLAQTRRAGTPGGPGHGWCPLQGGWDERTRVCRLSRAASYLLLGVGCGRDRGEGTPDARPTFRPAVDPRPVHQRAAPELAKAIGRLRMPTMGPDQNPLGAMGREDLESLTLGLLVAVGIILGSSRDTPRDTPMAWSWGEGSGVARSGAGGV